AHFCDSAVWAMSDWVVGEASCPPHASPVKPEIAPKNQCPNRLDVRASVMGASLRVKYAESPEPLPGVRAVSVWSILGQPRARFVSWERTALTEGRGRSRFHAAVVTGAQGGSDHREAMAIRAARLGRSRTVA